MNLTPFPVDPQVMARIRPMQFRDAARIAELHHAAMGDSLWARIGRNFLQVLYGTLIDSEGFLAFVYEEDGEVRGFIAGSTDPDRVMRETFRRAWWLLGPAALPGALQPGVLRRLAQTGRYARVSAVELPAGCAAESLFCSFAPELRGKRVAGHINKVLFDELAARGHRWVKITTDTSNTAARRQLESWGFVARGSFRFYGKEMTTWVLDLSACPRVEPLSRHPMIERTRAPQG